MINEAQIQSTGQKHVNNCFLTFAYTIILCVNLIYFPSSDLTFNLIRLFQVVEIVIWLYLFTLNFRFKSFQASPFNILTHCWWITLIFISMVMVKDMSLTIFFIWINVWLILLIINLEWKNDFVNQIHLLAIILSLLCYLNTILVALFPDGLFVETEWIGTGDCTRHLFGNYNQIGAVALLALLTQGIYHLRTGKGRLNLLMLCFINLGTIIFLGSMTSTIGISIIFVYLLFRRFIKHPFLFIFLFISAYFLFFIFIIWLNMSIDQIPFLVDFVENVLHKDITFTERTFLWENTVSLIQDHPWIGYGMQPITWMVDNIDGSGPHNLPLMIMLQGGLICFSIFIALCFLVFHKRHIKNTPEMVFALVTICSLMLMSLFETYNYLCIFLALAIGYYTSIYSQADKDQPLEKQ